MLRPYLFLLLFFLCTAGRTAAQSSLLLPYTAKDGLPSDMVYGTVCDSKGYVWLGTDKGAARYNGSKYTIFTTSDGLSDNEVFNFTEDGQGRLWIFTFKGSLCYFKDGTFHTAANTPWIAAAKGVRPFFMKFIRDNDGSLYNISVDNKVLLTVRDTVIRTYELDKIYRKLALDANDKVLNIKKLSAGRFRLWFQEVYADIDTNMNVLARYDYGHRRIMSSSTTENGILFFATDGVYTESLQRLYTYPKQVEKLANASAVVLNKHLFLSIDSALLVDGRKILGNAFVTGVSYDPSGNYWIALKGGGTRYLSKHLQDLVQFPIRYRGKVKAAAIFNHNLTFVTDHDDFYRLPANGTKTDTLFFNPHPISSEKNQFFNINYLIKDSMSYLRFHELGNFELGVTAGGTVRKRKIGKLWWDRNSRSLRIIKEVLPDGDSIYLFTISGLLRLPYQDLFRPDAADKLDTLIDSRDDLTNRISSRAIDPSDHKVWLSRSDGMAVLRNEACIRLPQFGKTVFRQFGFWSSYLVGRTDDNKLLVCNDYKGHPKIDTFIDKDCILDNIYPIDEQHAIIATNNYNRLLTLHPAAPGARPSYEVKVIEDPFLPQQADYIRADRDFCYFFANGSVTRLPTRLLFGKTPPPVTVLSSFRANDKNYPIQDKITIPYKESKSINIVFDNISFVGKEVICEYAIVGNGEKEQWTSITGSEINLNWPGFGDYTIQVRARTASSDFSRPALLHISILRPYWATWWFITLGILILVGLIWGIALAVTWRKLRIRQRQHEADMKYQQSEYKALNALMNPHFIFNSLNNIQGLINKDEKRTANEYLVIFSDLVRQNMHNISKGFISLQEELDLVENYLTLEKLRFKELVNYELVVDDEVETEVILIPPLLIQPLVENAVKHGLLPRQSPESIVRIHVYEQNDILYISITDNGIGVKRSMQRKNKLYGSFGLSNLKKRTEHLKRMQQQDIDIEVTELKDGQGNSKGTRAVIAMTLDSTS